MVEEKERIGIVREINLSGMNVAVHLMSTDKKEDIVFLLARGIEALEHIKDGDGKQ